MMNVQAEAVNKENVSMDLAPLSKNPEATREFGRDVTNNTFSDVNKNSFDTKDSQNTTDSDSFQKGQAEDADAREARPNMSSLHTFTKDGAGAC